MTGRELIEELKKVIKPAVSWTSGDEMEDVLFHAGTVHAVQAAERILQINETGSYTDQLVVGWVTRRL